MPTPMGTFLVTPLLVKEAIQLVVPAIDFGIKTELFKRPDFHVVVVNPVISAQQYATQQDWEDAGGILYEESFGSLKDCRSKYAPIARSKAWLSARWGMSTHKLQALHPHLLQGGDTVYGGSAARYGLVVAVSGLQAHFDQFVAGCILEAIYALCLDAREKGALGDGDFVGKPKTD